jgi:L-aminoadipate-semialdehyde dehydrogenase
MKIFLTGATGFLGGELVVELSKLSEVNKIYCLLRAESQELASSRLAKLFAFHNDYYDENKVIPVVGSLTEPDLIKSLSSYPFLKDVDIVIHSAANTSFLPQINI